MRGTSKVRVETIPFYIEREGSAMSGGKEVEATLQRLEAQLSQRLGLNW
jgi:hypothetical protein